MGTSRLIISDEERRQAASRLREELALMRDRRDWYRANEVPTAAGNLAYRNIADSVIPGSNIGSGYIEVVERLADLIDRGTCRNVYDEYAMGSCDNGFECSVCGNRVEDYEHYAVKGVFNYCSECGRKVVER